MSRSFRVLCVLFIWTLFACAPTGFSDSPLVQPLNLVTQDPNASPTPTPFQPVLPSETPFPSDTSTFIPTETFTPIPSTSTFTPIPLPPTSAPSSSTDAPPVPSSSRTNYIFYATLDFDAHTLDVEETIRYYNTTSQTLLDMVLSVQPNRWGNCFLLGSISQDGTSLTSYNLSGQRLTLNLPQALQLGWATT